MSLRRAAAAALAALGLLGVLGACAAEPRTPANPVVQPGLPGEANRTLSAEEASSAPPATPPNEADLAYARDMIAHHRQALVMTDLVPARGADATVRAFASRVADTQRPEIDMMNRWLRRNGQPEVDQHGGHDHADHAAMPGMASQRELDELAAASGADFDTRFLTMMIRHHEGAVAMADTVREDGVDVVVQEMADNVVVEQSDEIARMRGMLGA
ncbi:DUF305 domain-containing protein [Actinokineospora pegani]|uniref:DUF305 domain-containing protein n=1 Tax=Actinokineospora pegani TaxID=2654637 RepID=UPI001F3B97DC|nr:DUF305 domain-containing protein [Actinokineospora pegani]